MTGAGTGAPPAPKRYYRKVIRITAEDSPNVRLAKAQMAAGLQPTGEILIPGVLPYADYKKRRATWDEVRQRISLDALFWEGADTLLFPPQWLIHAERLADGLRGTRRLAKCIGVDPGEGVANTSLAAVDELGLIELLSEKTPDTNVIPQMIIDFGRRHGVEPHNWLIDRGGGGKQHADRIKAMGYVGVRTIPFGESVSLEPKRGITLVEERIETKEEAYVYKNRRAQMYGDLRTRADPNGPYGGFAVGSEYQELLRQLAPLPLLFDDEGRLYMLPKGKRLADGSVSGGAAASRRGKGQKGTLIELLGCSPDEADAVVLGVHGMMHKPRRAIAGAVG